MPTLPSFRVSMEFPVYSLGFTRNNLLVVGGGGGSSHSGVGNMLVVYKINTKRKDLEEEAQYEFAAEEDAPMALAVHPDDGMAIVGANENMKKVKGSKNHNCRLFELQPTQLVQTKAVSTITDDSDQDVYQKVARFSSDGRWVATATGKSIDVLTYPDLTSILDSPVSCPDLVVDVDLDDRHFKLTYVLEDALKLVHLRGTKRGQVIQTVSTSALYRTPVHLRAFRYGREISSELAFVVANDTRKRHGYLIVLDAHTLETRKVKQVSKKPITALTLSVDGALLAVAAADYSLTLFETTTLQVLARIPKAHTFAITQLAISPSRRILVSASADGSCRVVPLPLQFPNPSVVTINPFLTLLIAIVLSALLYVLGTLIFEDRSMITSFPFSPPPRDISSIASSSSTSLLTPSPTSIMS